MRETSVLRILALTAAALLVPLAGAQNLEIYFIDVEGGAATLIVTPAGETLLADSGWPREDDRDAKRIYDVVAGEVGADRLDYLLTTHYHVDHFGGVEALSKLLPIGRYLDHGDSIERSTPLYEAYLRVAGDNRTTLDAGDKLPLEGVDALVVASHLKRIGEPANGGGPNEALCADARTQGPERDPENDASIGFLLSFGDFQFLDLGDLTWNYEHALACPQNLVGKIDLYQTTHHATDRSGPPQHVRALAPTVAVMNNGSRKGGALRFFEVLRSAPGLEDIWQVHRSDHAGDLNSSDDLIANLQSSRECETGRWIRVTVDRGGKFTVLNSRNGFSKSYQAK